MDEFVGVKEGEIFNKSLSNEQINTIVAFINNNFQKNNSKSKLLANFKQLIILFYKNRIKLGLVDADEICAKCPQLIDIFDNVSEEIASIDDDNIQLLLNIYNNNKIANGSFDENSDKALFGDRFNKNDIDLLKLYFNEISKYDLLTCEEEIELCKKIEQGDEAALNELVNHNLRLVVNAAKYLVGHGVTYSDLIQEGNIGLMKAARKFSLSKGCKFSTYAMWWIRQTMLRSIPDSGLTIRIPVHMYEVMFKVKKETRIYSETHNGENPTVEYLSKKINEPTSKIEFAMKISAPIISLETPIGDEEDSMIGDFVEDDSINPSDEINKVYYEEFRKALDNCDSLNYKERETLRYRYGFYNNRTYTLEEIGIILNLTRERIRQIEVQAIRKLSRNSNIRKFAPEGYFMVQSTNKLHCNQSSQTSEFRSKTKDILNENKYSNNLSLSKKQVAYA